MKAILVSSMIVMTATAANAASAEGNSALALAALIAERSPLVAPADRGLLLQYWNGRADAPHRRGVIAVLADSVQCRAGNVDVTAWSCELVFRGARVRLEGRAAHELYATLNLAGVPPEGAAGSVFEAVSGLNCRINTDEVAQRGGGGAHCEFR